MWADQMNRETPQSSYFYTIIFDQKGKEWYSCSMKNLSFLITFIIFLVAGCATTIPPDEVPMAVEEPPLTKVAPEPAVEPKSVVEPEPVPEPEPEPPKKELTPEEQEFLRSTEALGNWASVTMDTFMKDKENVLETIDRLADIMKTGNYAKWLEYVSPESRAYWANPAHLSEVAKKLPVKGLKISSLRDYFKYIFVPSRSGHHVDEIRYISDTMVKAVQVQENRDIVFYTFEKIDGRWLLKLDTL